MYLFDNLAEKSAHPQTTMKIWGFSKPFWGGTDLRHETAIVGPKVQPKPEIPIIIVFGFFLLFQKQETQKMLKPYLWNPIL